MVLMHSRKLVLAAGIFALVLLLSAVVYFVFYKDNKTEPEPNAVANDSLSVESRNSLLEGTCSTEVLEETDELDIDQLSLEEKAQLFEDRANCYVQLKDYLLASENMKLAAETYVELGNNDRAAVLEQTAESIIEISSQPEYIEKDDDSEAYSN